MRRKGDEWRAAGQLGFTLLELMVAIAILALAVVIVAPSLNRARLSLTVRSAAYELAAGLRTARAAAQSGNREQIVDGFAKLSEIGLDGVVVSWPRYIDDMRWFQREIHPLMQQAGLR